MRGFEAGGEAACLKPLLFFSPFSSPFRGGEGGWGDEEGSEVACHPFIQRLIPPGKRSRVIAQTAEREIQFRQRMESVERLRAFQQELGAMYGQLPDSSEDIRRMREEQDAELTGMR